MNNRINHTLSRANTGFSKISDFFVILFKLEAILLDFSSQPHQQQLHFYLEKPPPQLWLWVCLGFHEEFPNCGRGGIARSSAASVTFLGRVSGRWCSGSCLGLCGCLLGTEQVCAWSISSWQLSLCSQELSQEFAEVPMYVHLCAVAALASTQQMAGGGVTMTKMKGCSHRLWYPQKRAAPDALMWQVNPQTCRKTVCWELRPQTSPAAGLYFGLGWHTRMGISSSPQLRLLTLLSQWW